jgi:hypothetical protein
MQLFVLGETLHGADSLPEAGELGFSRSLGAGENWLAYSGIESCKEVLIQC